MTYATIGKRAQRVSQLAFLHSAATADSAYQLEAPTLVGRRLQDGGRAGRARGPRTARRLPPHPVRPARTARRFVEIETTRPELIPACVALVAHPDDERYQPLFGTRGRRRRSSAWRAGARARARRSGEGHRHRDDLHVRRRDRRHVVARAEPSGARHHSADGTLGPVAWGSAGWESSDPARGAAPLRRARRACRRRRRARRSSSSCEKPATLIGEPRPITHAVKFYEKGDRPLEIITSRQWFIKTIDFREELLARGRELAVAPGRTCGRATRTGRTG